jgi:hypothetical protein
VPDGRLTCRRLVEAVPLVENPAMFDLACTQYEFPNPIPFADGNLLTTKAAGYRWSQAAVDRSVAVSLLKLAQLRELVG